MSSDLKDFLNAVERCIASQEALATQIDLKNPGDPYASLMVRDDIDLLQHGLEQILGAKGAETPATIDDVDAALLRSIESDLRHVVEANPPGYRERLLEISLRRLQSLMAALGVARNVGGQLVPAHEARVLRSCPATRPECPHGCTKHDCDALAAGVPASQPWEVKVRCSKGERTLRAGMRWRDGLHGSTWVVMEPEGGRIYSPSGLGGTPTFWCLPAGVLPEAAKHLLEGRRADGCVSFCGDSIAAGLIDPDGVPGMGGGHA